MVWCHQGGSSASFFSRLWEICKYYDRYIECIFPQWLGLGPRRTRSSFPKSRIVRRADRSVFAVPVGEACSCRTGAGKSTIIKLVIDLSTRDTEHFPTPVVGSVGLDVPTSGDVHLYLDPQSSGSNNPILYADCEGLEGGEREPLGARLKRKDKPSKVGRIGSFEQKVQRIHHTSEREITWANTNEKRSREFAVREMYPRLLYTFSDVVVFVLKNPR